MVNDDHERRDVLKWLAVLPALAALVRPPAAHAQAAGTTPVRVDTKGWPRESGSRARSRLPHGAERQVQTPGHGADPRARGHVGEHNHVGPGIRLMTLAR